MALATRRLYKPDRPAARKAGILHDQAPVACPNATAKEIAMAIAAMCIAANMEPGRGGEYDALKDEYTIIGRVRDGAVDATGMATGKVQDIKIPGVVVAALIGELRGWNGTPQFDPRGLTKALAGA
jgi:hypothetical protein